MAQEYIDKQSVRTPLVLSGLVVLMMVIFIEPSVNAMGHLPFSLHRQIAADNFVTGGLAIFTLVSLALHPVGQSSYRRWGQIGLVVGLLLHRLFWFPWRAALENGDATFSNWWRDDLAWITTFGQSFWWLGMILLMHHQLYAWAGKGWPLLAASMTIILWVVGYQTVDLFAWMVL